MLEQLKNDMKTAMKAREKERLAVIRSIQAELKNLGIDKKGKEGLTAEVSSPAEYLDEKEILAVLRSMVKKRKDSAEAYQKGGRDDLVQIELSEVEVIQGYLPQPLTEAETEVLVKEVIAEIDAQGMSDMGKVIKASQAKAAGRADGKQLAGIVRQLLG